MKMKMTAAQSSKLQSLSTTVLFRTMFTWVIMFNLLITPFSLIFSFFRQGHAAAVVEKKVYIFGGSSGSGFGGQHSDSTSDPIYLNDLFLLKGMQGLYRNHKC